MSSLKGVNINFTDAINDAVYAFTNTMISTDKKYQIQINTNNYINMYGIFHGVNIPVGKSITVKWGIGATDPDMQTYAELYEQYWDNPQIILDCIYALKYSIDDNGNISIKDWECDINSDNHEIILKEYIGSLDKVYVPSQILIDGVKYQITNALDS